MNFDVSEEQAFEPMVSIVIPVYNGSNYLKEAIDSALAQTYTNIEIIVVNDGSMDDGATEKIALSYGSAIRYIAKPNGGVSSALNEGIRQMKGAYFSWLSHDDAYHPGKVMEQVRVLSKLEDKKTVIKCSTEFMDDNSQPIFRKSSRSSSDFDRIIQWDEALVKLFSESGYNGCSLLIHRDIFDVCGLFDENLRFNQDGFMWTKIFLNRFSVYFIPYIGVKSRIHSGQLTRRAVDLFCKDCDTMSDYLIPRFLACTTKSYRLMSMYGVYNAKYRNRSVVKKIFKQADRHQLNGCERLRIRKYVVYGWMRSVLRKIYYRLFRRISVKGG